MGSCCSYCGNYSSKAEVAESAPIPFGSKFPVMRGMLTLQSMSTMGRVGSKEWGLLKGGLSPATVDSTELLALGTADAAPFHMDENFWKLFYHFTVHYNTLQDPSHSCTVTALTNNQDVKKHF